VAVRAHQAQDFRKSLRVLIGLFCVSNGSLLCVKWVSFAAAALSVAVCARQGRDFLEEEVEGSFVGIFCGPRRLFCDQMGLFFWLQLSLWLFVPTKVEICKRLLAAGFCCSVLQCVAVCCSVLQCAAVCCSVLQCAAVCCNVLLRVAVRCSVLQCAIKVTTKVDILKSLPLLDCVAVCCVCCSVLQCVASQN